MNAWPIAIGDHEPRPIRGKGRLVGTVLMGVFEAGIFVAGVRVEQTYHAKPRLHRQEASVGRKGRRGPHHGWRTLRLLPGINFPEAQQTAAIGSAAPARYQ